MKRIQLPLVLLAILLLPGSTTGCSAKEYPLKETLEKRIHKLMRRQHLPGFAITVVNNQDVIYQEAFGFADLENEIPAGTSTVFRLWSVSKLFTALEIFREVEEGLVDLDDPLAHYLPEFSIQSRSGTNPEIRLRSILAHRSGLPRNECENQPVEEMGSRWLYKFEEAVGGCYTAFPEGSRYHYSNLGYDLLGRVIEIIRQEGYAPYMKKHMFEELGMFHTTFSSEDLGDTVLVAGGYEFYKGEYYPVLRPDISSLPSGNLYSTIEDLSIFLASVFRQDIFASDSTMPLMFRDHFSTAFDPETMGLGWKTTRLQGTELLVYHDGGPSDGTGALVALLPERKLGIALMGNGTTLSGGISLPFAMEVFQEILDPGRPAARELPAQDEPGERSGTDMDDGHAALENFEGNYALFGQLMEIKAKKRKLKAGIDGMSLDLIPVSEHSFRVTHWLQKTGLTRIFKPPIDFDRIHISFCDCNSPDNRGMIINFDNISYEFGPRYPDQLVGKGGWEKLSGEYRMARRLPDNSPGAFTGQNYTIYLEGHVLVMSGIFGPVVPVNDQFLEILSGPFAGETIEFNSNTGCLIHQNAVFIPVAP